MRFTLREGLKKLKHYKRLTFATFLTSTISYLVLGVFLLITLSLVESFNMFQQSETKMVAFVDAKASEGTIYNVSEKIYALDGVTSIEYISSEDGLKKLENSFENKGLVKEFEEDNPIPHTYVIGFEDSKRADVAYKVLDSVKDIEKIEYEKEYLNEISKTLKNFKTVLICIVFGLLLSSVFFIVIVISLSIYNQQKNIKIMLITGSPIKYISRPFIIQGILISLTSALLSSFITVHLHNEYLLILKKVFPFMAVLSKDLYGLVPIVIVILGLILGFVGSKIAATVEINKVIKKM